MSVEPVPGHQPPAAEGKPPVPAGDDIAQAGGEDITGASPWADRGGKSSRRRKPRQRKRHTPEPAAAGVPAVTEAGPTPEQIQQADAQALYDKAVQTIHDATFSPVTEKPADEGEEMVKLKNKDRSYALVSRLLAKNFLGFEYTDDRRMWQDGVLQRQRPNNRNSQDLEAHTHARDMITIILTDRVAADKARVATAAVLPDEAGALSKLKVVHRGKGKPKPLAERLAYTAKRAELDLENLRFNNIEDAIDWFAARVNQVESQVNRLTVRTPGSGSVKERIDVVNSHAGLKTEVAELEADMVMIKGLAVLEVVGLDAKDTARRKRNIEKQIKRAENILARYKRDRTELNKLIEQDLKQKVMDYEVPKKIVADVLLARKGSITDAFFAECEKRLDGLTPEEEKQFWSAMLEIFDDAVSRDNVKDPRKRAEALVKKLHIFEVAGTKATLIQVGDRKLVQPGELPENLGQLIERCKVDAGQLAEIREKMKKTFAIMGKDFQHAVRDGLKGNPNETKLNMVDQLNKVLGPAQDQAIKALLTGDGEFKTALGARKARDLKWREEADRPLVEKIRGKILADLNLGTVDSIALEPLIALMTPPTEAETAPVDAETEADGPVVSAYERIREGNFAAELITDETVPGKPEAIPTDVQIYVDKLFNSLTPAMGSAKLSEAMKVASDGLVKDLKRAEDLITYVRALENIVLCSQSLKAEYGKKWPEDVGLLKNKEPNQTLLDKVCRGMSDGDTFIVALELSERPQDITRLQAKINPEVRNKLTGMGLTDADVIEIATVALAQNAGQENIERGQALNRVAAYLQSKRGEAQLTGENLLLVAGLVEKVDGGGVAFQDDKIREVMETA